MKRKCSGLAEVHLQHPGNGPSSCLLLPGSGASAAFAVHLPEGATVTIPAGFDADELFTLLFTVREVLR
jgi:hypothetical protein